MGKLREAQMLRGDGCIGEKVRPHIRWHDGGRCRCRRMDERALLILVRYLYRLTVGIHGDRAQAVSCANDHDTTVYKARPSQRGRTHRRDDADYHCKYEKQSCDALDYKASFIMISS